MEIFIFPELDGFVLDHASEFRSLIFYPGVIFDLYKAMETKSHHKPRIVLQSLEMCIYIDHEIKNILFMKSCF